jgi:uncharacterized phage protein (TIGR01671 family)
MNKEIKFKAWDPVSKFFHAPMTMHQMLDICALPSDAVQSIAIKFRVTRNDLEFLQSTGLKDKNGKELFEGDVYRYQYEYDSDYDGDMPIVKTSSGVATIKDVNDTYWVTQAKKEGGTVELIGNIYENPELIKK